MDSLGPRIPPVTPIPPIPDAPSQPRPSVALWRWWVALLIIGSSPLLAALSSTRRVADDGAMIPKTVPGLLVFCALQLGIFGVMWTIFWLLSRADKDELFLRLRGFWKTLGWGVLYSFLMRFGLVLVAMTVLMILALAGLDPMKTIKVMQENGQGAQKAFAPALQGGDPLYRVLMITLISFVVAGLREELWRVATMAGLSRVAPRGWNQNQKNALSLGVSSVIFGLGHLYQGVTGVVGTTLLGLAMGAIILQHRSVWPAVVAHGCFNAVSFAALFMMGKGS